MAEHNSWSGFDNVYKDKAPKNILRFLFIIMPFQVKHLIEKEKKRKKRSRSELNEKMKLLRGEE